MLSLVRRLIAVAVLVAALPLLAATPSEFYLTMLRKGVTAYETGRLDAAAGPLRIAAFGFVDSVDHYQTAQVYLTLTYDRLGDVEMARRAARALVTAERIDPRYGSLQIPEAARTAFRGVAQRLLTPAEIATLERSPQTAAPQAAVTTPPVNPPVNTQPVNTQPADPQPANPQPANPQPTQSAQTQPRPQTPPPTTPQTQTQTPPQSSSSSNGNSTTTPPRTNPPATTRPAPATPAEPAMTVSQRFAAAEQALTEARLTDARTHYRELLALPSLERAQLLRLAEGFYRSRDFAHALRAFERLGALRAGEEPYRYYIAVALYETGEYARAKQELTAVLPFIEITPDVARYRTKIEGAVN